MSTREPLIKIHAHMGVCFFRGPAEMLVFLLVPFKTAKTKEPPSPQKKRRRSDRTSQTHIEFGTCFICRLASVSRYPDKGQSMAQLLGAADKTSEMLRRLSPRGSLDTRVAGLGSTWSPPFSSQVSFKNPRGKR